MSEPLANPRNPRDEANNIMFGLAHEVDGTYSEVHERFSLTQTEGVDGIITTSTGERSRYLVVAEPQHYVELYQRLQAGGVPEFHRREVHPGLGMYDVPLAAKPLSHEQLFLHRPSTETYVSDQELYEELGGLWRAVWEASHAVPEMPLSGTALLDFNPRGKRLVPIPPNNGWQSQGNKHSARDHFMEALEAELRRLAPEKPYRTLLRSVLNGWEKGNGN